MTVFLCIDLEATSGPSGLLRDMEAIELGGVAIDHTGTIFDQFQSFIKPKFTKLDHFSECVHGISGAQLELASNLPLVLRRLESWTLNLPESPTCWYSWGLYDLQQLEYDAGPERWDVPLRLPEHRNAKKLFQKNQLKNGRQVGLRKALEIVGLKFDGKHHRAVDDARNLARLLHYYHTQE